MTYAKAFLIIIYAAGFTAAMILFLSWVVEKIGFIFPEKSRYVRCEECKEDE